MQTRFNKIDYKLKVMGLECTKGTQRPREWYDRLKVDDLQSELRNIKDVTTFSIKINDLRFLNFCQTFNLIKIEIPNDICIEVSSKDFEKHDKIWITRKHYTAEIRTPVSEIAKKIVTISILGRAGEVLDELKMKLYHLSTGPVKHDHLLKNLKSRLLFDLHIEQFLQVGVTLKECGIAWKNFCPLGDQAYILSLILSNAKDNIYVSQRFEKHWKIKELKLDKINIRNSKLSDSIIRLKLTVPGFEENHIEYYIPYSTILQLSSYRQLNSRHGNFQDKEITRTEEVVINGQNVGNITFTLAFTKSKLYVQQMECVIFSQHGIVLTTATDYKHNQRELNLETIKKYLKSLKHGKNYGMSDLEFVQMLEELHRVLQEGNQFQVADDLFEVQDCVLDFLLQLQDCLEEDKVVRNDFIWRIINLILHKKLMNLRYFGSIGSSSLQKKYAMKYYTFLINTLIRLITFIMHGISFKELASFQKFVAYTFFRFSWCQNQIIQALSKPSDPVLSEEKIAEIGASIRSRSPSKSYFYDWQTNVLSLIKRQEEFAALMNRLDKKCMENPQWAALLFDREYEQLFYGLFSELWDEAQIFLNNSGRIMWEYFPRYGDLLSIFLGQMNDSSGILDFPAEMTRCNMKLIKNQKLLNTFMMLIFPKTCLYETYSVLKCLDLINCYFSVIVSNKKKIPHDFQYNYFYTGIRCILESNHSILVQVMLSMLYKYYTIFTKEFKETLNHYITCHVFNPLFLHWSQQVRSIFHLIIIFRIMKDKELQNPEYNTKNTKSSFGRHIEQREAGEAMIEMVNGLRDMIPDRKSKKNEKMQYFQKMKLKLAEKYKQRSRMRNFLSPKSTNSIDSPLKVRLNSEDFIDSPLMVRRKWSLAGYYDLERSTPTESELKYLQMSLQQFQLAKKETNPDEIVETRSKMLQLNIDQ